MTIVNYILHGSMTAVLVFLSWMDIRKQEVVIWIPGIPSAAMLIFLVIEGEYYSVLWHVLSAIAVILMGILITRLTGGAVGEGDAWMWGGVFLMLGVLNGISALIIALLCAAGFSAGLLMIKKVNKKWRIPFAPFICGGYILTLVGMVM